MCQIHETFNKNQLFGICQRCPRCPRSQRKWCQQVLLRPSLPHTPGVRMTGVKQTPSNYISDNQVVMKYTDCVCLCIRSLIKSGQAWAQMGPGPNGPRPKWDRAQLGRGPNGLGPKWAGAQMGMGPNGPGESHWFYKEAEHHWPYRSRTFR